MSRQSVHLKAGDKEADFHKLDEVGNRCAEINKKALAWAMNKASPKALKRYHDFGNKLVFGDDTGPFKSGPLWIWHPMSYEDNADKTETLVQSPMIRTPSDSSVFAGFHYCKLLSPYRALEWIYVDSLYDRDGLKQNAIEDKTYMLFLI